MNFDTCPHCQGLVPAGLTACPHCDHAVSTPSEPTGIKAAKTIAKAAAVGATAMTLMACYGVGYYEDDGYGNVPVDPNLACDSAQVLALEVSPNGENHTAFTSGSTVGGYDAFDHCTGTASPERLFTLDPGAMRGQAGTLTIIIEGDRHTVWTADRCDDSSGSFATCGQEDNNGQVSVVQEVSSLQAATIAVEALSSSGGDFQLQVIFEPTTVP